MNYKFTGALVSTTLTLAGCFQSSLVWEEYKFPPTKMVATRGVGEKILEQGIGELAPEFELSQDAFIGSNKIPKGRYEFAGENRRGIWFEGEKQYFYINKSDQTICIDDQGCTKIEYTLNKKPLGINPDYFQQTLLYNGKIGNRITLGYREFADNMARVAFSNNVDYDLSESTIVGYKGARLEIIKATNTEITYRVLSGFAN